MAAPRQNVGGDEKLADGQAGDGAAVAVVVKDDLAEVILSAALFGGPGDFGVSAWRTFDRPNSGAGDDFGGFRFGFHEEGVESFLTEGDEFGGVFVEFLPDSKVKVAGTLEALNAAQLERGVQRGEIAKFHRHGTGRATDPVGQVDDYRLALVELTEAELVIEIEDDEKFISGPAIACGHG